MHASAVAVFVEWWIVVFVDYNVNPPRHQHLWCYFYAEVGGATRHTVIVLSVSHYAEGGATRHTVIVLSVIMPRWAEPRGIR